MRLIIIVLILIDIPIKVFSQVTLTNNAYTQCIASISSETTSGGGFIISQDSKYTYLATALHVVKNEKEVNILLPLYNISNTGEVIASDSKDDIAIIKMSRQPFDWKPFNYLEEIKGGIGVFAFAHRDNFQLMGLRESVLIESYNEDRIEARLGASPGDSGGAIFFKEGIVAMIIKSPGIGVPIKKIKNLAYINNIPWDLKPIYVKDQIETRTSYDIKAEQPASIKYAYYYDKIVERKSVNHVIIKTLSTKLNANEVFDNNSNTFHVFKKYGTTRLILKLDSEKIINKMKIFIPENELDIFPSNFRFEIDELNVSIKLKKKKMHYYEEDVNGVWITFDLNKYYKSDTFALSFFIDIDSKKIEIPFNIYEIKFFGPKTL